MFGGAGFLEFLDGVGFMLPRIARILTYFIVIYALIAPFAILNMADAERTSGRLELVRVSGAPLAALIFSWQCASLYSFLRLVLPAAPFYLFAWVADPTTPVFDALLPSALALLIGAPFCTLVAAATITPLRWSIPMGVILVVAASWVYTAYGLTPPLWLWCAAALWAVAALPIAAVLLGRTPRSTVNPNRSPAWARLAPLDAGARFIAMNGGAPPYWLLNAAVLIGGFAAAAYSPFLAILGLLAYIELSTQAFMDRVWSSPLLEDLYMANWDPVDLARDLPMAAAVRIAPAAPPLIAAGLHAGAVGAPISLFPNLVPADWATALLQSLFAGALCGYFVMTAGRRAAHRSVKSEPSPFLQSYAYWTAFGLCIAVVLLTRFVTGMLYPLATIFADTAALQHGLVFLALAAGAAITARIDRNGRREFENAVLRYINDNAFSDFGAFRPVRRDRPSF